MKSSILWAIFFPALLIAQELSPLDWDRLLGSVYQDVKMQGRMQKMEALKSLSGKPLWKSLELRYELDGLDLREHKFDLRLSPLAWGERSAMGDKWQSRLRVHEAQRNHQVARALAERYRLGLYWIYYHKQNAYHQSMLAIYKDREQVHLALTGTERFDPEALVQTQVDMIEWQSTLLADQNDIAELEQSLKQLVGNWNRIAFNDQFIPVDSVRNFLVRYQTQLDSTLPEVRIAQEELELVKSKLAIDNARSRGWVSQVMLGYQHEIPKAGKSGPETTEQISIGLGIRIPFGDDRKADVLQSQVELLDAQSDLQQLKWDYAKELADLRMQVGSLLAQKSVLDSFALRVDAGALFSDFATRAGSDPLLLLKARESALRSQWRSEKLRFDIYFLYIKMLEKFGILANDPGRNHLTKMQ